MNLEELRTEIDAIDDTLVNARGTMQGSWRPCISKVVFSPRDRLTLSWGCAMEGVGFTATRNTRGIPLVIPPRIPPAWLVRVFTCPPSM